MSNRFLELIEGGGVLFADGGMGTGLFARGLATGDCPELWNVDHPDRVADCHGEFVGAGADIILTNTFGANARRLALHGAESRVAELSAAGARLARAVADAAGRPVAVAGSMGPTGDILAPLGPLSGEAAEAVFRAQASALAAGGADVLWIETISSVEELRAALSAAGTTGLPVVATMSFDTNGRTMMGLTPEDAVRTAAEAAHPPVAFGANCGIGPAELLDTVVSFAGAAAPRPLIVAKGNCGIPQYSGGHLHYSGTPEVMADYAVLARDAGARIIGGCCGTTGEHVRAMVSAVRATPPGPAPDRETIVGRFGPLRWAAKPAEPKARRRRA